MIKVENLYKSFGKQTVLSGISLSINSGETLAIVGPSGTGKSVLLKIITGLMQADSGNIELFGQKLDKKTPKKLRDSLFKRIGILFQGAALIDSMTLFENLSLPLIERKLCSKKEAISLCNTHLKEVGLQGKEDLYPQEVSVGIRKRLGIARALITDPALILFDEPNTSLDPVAGQEIYDLISQIQNTSGITGIVISHEIPEVFQIAERVIMLYGGKVRFDGSTEEFNNSSDPVVSQFVNGKIEGPIVST